MLGIWLGIQRPPKNTVRNALGGIAEPPTFPVSTETLVLALRGPLGFFFEEEQPWGRGFGDQSSSSLMSGFGFWMGSRLFLIDCGGNQFSMLLLSGSTHGFFFLWLRGFGVEDRGGRCWKMVPGKEKIQQYGWNMAV